MRFTLLLLAFSAVFASADTFRCDLDPAAKHAKDFQQKIGTSFVVKIADRLPVTEKLSPTTVSNDKIGTCSGNTYNGGDLVDHPNEVDAEALLSPEGACKINYISLYMPPYGTGGVEVSVQTDKTCEDDGCLQSIDSDPYVCHLL